MHESGDCRGAGRVPIICVEEIDKRIMIQGLCLYGIGLPVDVLMGHAVHDTKYRIQLQHPRDDDMNF